MSRYRGIEIKQKTLYDKENFLRIKELRKYFTKENKQLIGRVIRSMRESLKKTKYEFWYQGNMINSRGYGYSLGDKKVIVRNYITSLRSKREQRKASLIEEKNYNGYKYIKINGIIATPLADVKRLYTIEDVRKNKKPTQGSKTNYVGIEIEMCSNITKEQLEILVCEHKLSHVIKIHGDSSIQTEPGLPYQIEVTFLLNEWNYKQILDKFKVMMSNENYKFKCNASCGTHIHLDMRNRDAEAAYRILYKNLNYLFSIVADHRKRSEYCIKNVSATLSQAGNNPGAQRGGRYQAINPEALQKYNTLELRLFEGTLDVEKIKFWISELLDIVNNGVEKKVGTNV